MPDNGLPIALKAITYRLCKHALRRRLFFRGRTGFDGDAEALVAGRGAAGLVKSGTKVIANNDDYAYAYAA